MLVRERPGNVLVARLNRPEARNALDATLIRSIGEAMNDADADPEIRAVVLTGTGDRAFCAGMDLRAFAGGGATTGDDPRGHRRVLPAGRGRGASRRAVRHSAVTARGRAG